MRIPVFVSGPTALSRDQERVRNFLIGQLADLMLEPRALGRSDYPAEYPLREVYVIARHCSGGVILGFEQTWVKTAVVKRGSPEERQVDKPFALPTPWNHLEAGILFGLKLPLLIFKETSISGGVFDVGVTDVFVHTMPPPRPTAGQKEALKEVFLKWHARVQEHYKAY